jgi:hypothetical protein
MSKYMSIAGFAAIAALVANSAGAAVLNPSFEIGSGSLPNSCGTGCSYSAASTVATYNTTTIPDWAISPFTIQAGVLVPSSDSLYGYLLPVPNGVAVAYTTGGTISQTLSPTVVVGRTYALTAWITDANVENVSLYIGTGGFGSEQIYATPTGLTSGVWEEVGLTYVGLASYEGVSTAGEPITAILFNQGGAGSQYFDAVNLAPLPASWTMMLIGLAGLGVFAYRGTKNRSPVAAA